MRACRQVLSKLACCPRQWRAQAYRWWALDVNSCSTSPSEKLCILPAMLGAGCPHTTHSRGKAPGLRVHLPARPGAHLAVCSSTPASLSASMALCACRPASRVTSCCRSCCTATATSSLPRSSRRTASRLPSHAAACCREASAGRGLAVLIQVGSALEWDSPPMTLCRRQEQEDCRPHLCSLGWPLTGPGSPCAGKKSG
jgi:hypothetical protein